MGRNRKRDKPHLSRHVPTSSLAKRLRPMPHHPRQEEEEDVVDKPIAKPAPAPPLVVMGLPMDCSVLDVKSRFEIYGSISRIRIDGDGSAYVMYRAKDSAQDAYAAAQDPSLGISVDSKKVQVIWATDPLAQWRQGVGLGGNKDNGSSSSKLLRAEVPLSRHGRGNKLASAIVSPRSSNDGPSTVSEVPFRGREIVAYDDIL
ncbi:hypothetical protein I3843_06G074900 [Carya illinoinensis]|uniref:RRM domain-containing protein n=1 Tax=Carya illinoinensis TaxID=32201 RepID=A0A8T1Q968_CARIL|nr:uncharacterized protein At1g27050-like [Carya illinoinensis]KAG2702238.1 hypothetical protein I3760_06G081100 [Carya illinoinensis]KAG6650977.1 hypothetical protein CIPAW_06G080300 [Carya illinoinensis]KAG6708428.1 hypothetical protein I3842_06G081000 [Carya illinoinensis]KAG7974978.1 hypothetical protein I3843_06G074900 [Carya illinoinensis]